VGIITSFLNRDKKDVQLDYYSLTNLSEQSRVETCHTLRQLFRRMSQPQLPARANSRLALQSRQQVSGHGVQGDRKRRRKAEAKHSKIRGPTIARVVIQDSSRPSQVAIVKPGERRKKSGSSTLSSRTHSAGVSAISVSLPTPPPPYELPPDHPPRPTAHRTHTTPDVPKPRRKQSAATIRSPPVPSKPEALRATKSTPRLQNLNRVHQNAQPQASTSTAALPTAIPSRRREREPIPTYYSMASDSTKLGEIPLHRWAEPFDFDAMSAMNHEAERNGYPGVQGEEGNGRKKRRGLFGLFRRKENIT
jgi:hypothetical protein